MWAEGWSWVWGSVPPLSLAHQGPQVARHGQEGQVPWWVQCTMVGAGEHSLHQEMQGEFCQTRWPTSTWMEECKRLVLPVCLAGRGNPLCMNVTVSSALGGTQMNPSAGREPLDSTITRSFGGLSKEPFFPHWGLLTNTSGQWQPMEGHSHFLEKLDSSQLPVLRARHPVMPSATASQSLQTREQQNQGFPFLLCSQYGCGAGPLCRPVFEKLLSWIFYILGRQPVVQLTAKLWVLLILSQEVGSQGSGRHNLLEARSS